MLGDAMTATRVSDNRTAGRSVPERYRDRRSGACTPALVAMCPACGFDALDEEPWSDDSASDEICPCCALHFGYDDFGELSA